MPENIEKYLVHVERFDMTYEQKIELLRNVYYVMKGFVDMAFGVEPTQQALGLPRILLSEFEVKALDSDDISKTSNN